jgi:hypothetical protein
MHIIEPYTEDGGEELRLCQHAVFSSNVKCSAEVVLRDVHGENAFLCKTHATQELKGNPELLARAVIEIALMVRRPV